MRKLPSSYRLAPEVNRALAANAPVVALETTVVTHGLPKPENLDLARDMESEVIANGATPATIGVLDGLIRVGMSHNQLELLTKANPLHKISRRDFAGVVARGGSGGTTVAGTMIAAYTAGIRVFATGGIGGVHQDVPFDISPDLKELSQTPMVVVCSGAKSILDLPATLEVLETLGVPVVGFQTDEFPAFYTQKSGLPVSVRADTPKAVAELAVTHWELGLKSAVLVVVPIPPEASLSKTEVDAAVNKALDEAEKQNIRGQHVTPFLLNRVSDLTGRASLKANLSLLLNNARIAAQISNKLNRRTKNTVI